MSVNDEFEVHLRVVFVDLTGDDCSYSPIIVSYRDYLLRTYLGRSAYLAGR